MGDTPNVGDTPAKPRMGSEPTPPPPTDSQYMAFGPSPVVSLVDLTGDSPADNGAMPSAAAARLPPPLPPPSVVLGGDGESPMKRQRLELLPASPRTMTQRDYAAHAMSHLQHLQRLAEARQLQARSTAQQYPQAQPVALHPQAPMTKQESKAPATVLPWEVVDLTEEDDDEGAMATKPAAAAPEKLVPVSAAIYDVESNDEVLLVDVLSRIVGVKYFKGEVSVRENVVVQRDLGNTLDPNALKVVNMSNVKVGHIPQEQSRFLSPLLDQRLVRIEGTVTEQAKYSVPLQLHVYGRPEYHPIVVDACRKGHLIATDRYGAIAQRILRAPVPTADAVAASSSSFAASIHRDMLEGGQVLESSKQVLEEIFAKLQQQQLSLPKAPQPRLLQSRLLPHQQQGLWWMLQREQPKRPSAEAPVFFWQWDRKRGLYYNMATHSAVADEPYIPRGGILADDMGLGKTIQVIGLIVASLDAEYPIASVIAGVDIGDSSAPGRAEAVAAAAMLPAKTPVPSIAMLSTDGSGGPADAPPPATLLASQATLIICPLSVISNWVSQIESHTQPGTLSIYVYHGAGRSADAAFIAQHGIVITTYTIMAQEFVPPNVPLQTDHNPDVAVPAAPLRQGILHQIHWNRVVLDEAHAIKSMRTKQAVAACGLQTHRRWCLTGTPIQNQLEDLYSLVKFLRAVPFWDHYWWMRLFARPLRVNPAEGVPRLQELMQYLCLRRVKNAEVNGERLITLPERNVVIYKISLAERERVIYDMLEKESAAALDDYIAAAQERRAMGRGAAGDADQAVKYTHFLVLLTRLRQLCNHSSLAGVAGADKSLSAASALRLGGTSQELLAILHNNEVEDCAVCMKELKSPTITPCVHTFCWTCIEPYVQEKGECPVCQRSLQLSDLLRERGPASDAQRSSARIEAAAQAAATPSPKIDAMLLFLETTRHTDASIKTVIFSQWTSMLDIVEHCLRARDFVFTRLDGDMARKQREEVIDRFMTDPSVTVFLVSLRCGGVGLNLTAASQVLMMDPWWNPAAEDQAIDRVHRIGQTKTVNVIRFIVENSVEERVLALQQRKRELMDQAFGRERNRDVLREQRFEELRMLMQPLNHDR